MLNKTVSKLLIHTLFWVLFIIVLFVFDADYEEGLSINWFNSRKFFLLALIFIISYINDLVLLPYFVQKKIFLSYTVVVLTMIIITTLFYCSINCADSILLCFSVDIWIVIIPVVSLSLIWMVFMFLNKQRELEKSNNDRIKLELKFLKTQINPHVLFNSLNTIYAKAVNENEEIAEMILMLSQNLKYVLNKSNDTFVDLEKDITFIENYLEFQKSRTQGINNIIYKKEVDSYNHSIAPLILIDFIENAFKHSTYKDGGLSDITINLNIKNGEIHFICSNEFDSTNIHQENNDTTQIGLKNLKQRLELIYKNKYVLNINKENGVFKVDLKIDLE
jgi:LytS/YehU family sensor histidine kinase